MLNRASAAGPEGIGYEEASCLVGLVAALRNPDLALEYAKSMAKEGATVSQPSESVVLAAHALCTEASEFGRLFKRLDKLTLDNREMKAVLRLDRKLRDKGWAGIIKEAVLERDVAAVLAIAERWEALISLGGECDPPERSHPGDAAGWMNQYPPEFRGPLAALSCLKPGAERTARRIFGEDYISPEALDREIAVLEAKVKTAPASGVLAKRLANLRERRASAVSITPKKSFRLKKRLNRAVRTEVFSRWARRLDEEFLENLGKPLGTASLPPEFILPGFLPVLTSIMGLSKPFRELGLELLRRRCAPPPWNLYDHPANRAFLERVRKNGVDPDPWIERGASRIVRAENGKRLRIALEDDPLEVFQMGAYFHTCLKPGGVNFYSVVSNAADINKRVLFARDEDGKVAGRCLFALTDGGGILTFHPYSHDKGLGFSGIVSRYASELASRMKTAVVFSGTVECLVAPKWYDDGPRDTGFRFPFLEEESDFRSQLKTLKPAELPDKVKAAVGPLAPNSLTLAPIIMLPELKERPELLVPLQPLLERCDDLPVEVWSRAADLARKAGRLDQARRILRKFIIPCELRQLKSEYIREVDEQVIELALDIDPSATLRLFRQTRPRGVRRDEHEPPYRKKHIVSAHERLGRDTVARRLGGKEE